jgi:hypothetical protein
MLDCSEDDLLAVVAGKGGLHVSVGDWGKLTPALRFPLDKKAWSGGETVYIRSLGCILNTRKKYVCELGLEAELYKAWLL